VGSFGVFDRRTHGNKVSRIESLNIQATVAADQVGIFREPTVQAMLCLCQSDPFFFRRPSRIGMRGWTPGWFKVSIEQR